MRYSKGPFPLLAFALVVGALAGSGCDFLTPGGPSYAGVVVEAGSGNPVEGIQISLQVDGGGFGGGSVVAETLTSASGKFSVRDPGERGNGAALYVNAPGYTGDDPSPFNPAYTSGPVDYTFEGRHDIRIELQRASN